VRPVKELLPSNRGGLTEVFRAPEGSIQAQIDAAVEQLKPGTGAAVLAFKTGEGAKLGAVFKTQGNWSFGGFFEHGWKGEFDPHLSFKIVKEF
jgi:hypothetical protein